MVKERLSSFSQNPPRVKVFWELQLHTNHSYSLGFQKKKTEPLNLPLDMKTMLALSLVQIKPDLAIFNLLN